MGIGNGNVEAVTEERGAHGHSRTRNGKGFSPPFLLRPLWHATRAEDTPKPVCRVVHKHSRIHSLPQTRLRAPSPLNSDPFILSLLSIHLLGRHRSRIRSNAVEKPTNTKRDKKHAMGKNLYTRVDYGSPGLVADIQKDMTPLFLSDMPDEKARATPPEVVVPIQNTGSPRFSDT